MEMPVTTDDGTMAVRLEQRDKIFVKRIIAMCEQAFVLTAETGTLSTGKNQPIHHWSLVHTGLASWILARISESGRESACFKTMAQEPACNWLHKVSMRDRALSTSREYSLLQV